MILTFPWAAHPWPPKWTVANSSHKTRSNQVSSHVSLLCHVSHHVSMMSKWAEEASLTVALFSADAQNALVPPVRDRWRQVRLFQIRNLQTHLFCFLFWFWFCFSCFSHCILFCRCKQLADSCAKMLKDVELHLWMNSKNLQTCDSKQHPSCYALHYSDLSDLVFQYGPPLSVTNVLCFSSPHVTQQICTSITDKVLVALQMTSNI